MSNVLFCICMCLGAWPVLIDEFVEHMYIINGSEDARSFSCNCGDLETEPIVDSLPGMYIQTVRYNTFF